MPSAAQSSDRDYSIQSGAQRGAAAVPHHSLESSVLPLGTLDVLRQKGLFIQIEKKMSRNLKRREVLTSATIDEKSSGGVPGKYPTKFPGPF